MQIKTLIIALFAGIAMALPTDPPKNGGGGGGGGSTPPPSGGGGGSGDYDACEGNGTLYSSAQCCATDVLGIADLDCAVPTTLPTSASSFTSICAAKGQRARCCVLPVAGQAVLCQAPVGA
ncbi:hypothetical protein MCOR25_009944 [Pyricularia grisea]|uniref:Uncharacterized protein n=1 Tax=Pyricularia grisea TaxID=148305 RepID=A0A6P8AR50_PYRGI|nr:uncharacterized protein PgNI_12213 [Pyricularia grisea]KAI6351408.1 hypothetical protein MCOR25_009944 [Pyricularia grisea]TLD04540.1 hypothetical protein PgNI_12213 [Pyricularia grisea]